MPIKARLPGFRRLDLYLLGEVTGPFLGGILFFSFIFLMFQMLRLAEFFIIHGVSGWLLLKMTGLIILSFLPTALPVAFLIGILVGFGRLSADSELVAMKANGISIHRLSAPVVGLALLVSCFSLGLNFDWVPWGDHTLKNTIIKVSNTKVVASIKEGTFTTGFFDLLVYADRLDPKTNRLHKVFIYDEREPKNPMTIIAREGEILPVRTDSETAASVVMKLYDGNIHRNDITTATYQKIDFATYQTYLKVEEGTGATGLKPRMIPHRDLVRQIQETSRDNKTRNLELRNEYWRRYAVALSPFIFVFLGIGYGTVRTRAVRAGAALIAFLVIVVYWSVQATAAVLSSKGFIPPFVAQQLANLIMLIVAVRGYRSATW